MIMSKTKQPALQELPLQTVIDCIGLKLRVILNLNSVFFYLSFLVFLMLYTLNQYVTKTVQFNPVFARKGPKIVSQMEEYKKDLADDWSRVNKLRVDWQTMLEPCLGNMAWGKTKPGFERNMKTSANESYIDNMVIRPAGEFSKIFLRSRTKDGQEKHVGGDFWRVVFQGPSNVHATVFDHSDGSYEAMALLIEPGEYSVVATLEYTLCQGMKDPPEYWFRAGNAQGTYQPHGILNTSDVYLHETLQNGKKIAVEISPRSYLIESNENHYRKLPCSASCSLLPGGNGRWVKENWVPYIKSASNRTHNVTKRLGTLWIYGDSLAVRFHSSISGKLLCWKLFTRCQRTYTWAYPLPKGGEFQAKRQNDDLDFRPWVLLDSIRNVLRRKDMQSSESLLVLNLGLHFPTRINFTTYQGLIRDVVRVLKFREQKLGSKAKVIWKTTTAPHHEQFKVHNDVVRFFTSQRTLLYDKFAMSAMCEASIDVLDVYHLSASYPHGTYQNDAVHYPNKVFLSAELEIEKYARNAGLEKNTQKNCIG